MPTRLLPLLIVLCLLSACAAPAAAPTATPPPSATLPPTAAPTAAPTFTPLVPTLTPTEIPTPIPTLSPEDTKALLFGLLADNGGCQLPCLWGFAIGRTDLQTVDNFLTQFGAFDQDSFYSTGPESFSYPAIDIRGKRVIVKSLEQVEGRGDWFFNISFRYSFEEDVSGQKVLKGLYLNADSNTTFNSETGKPHGYGSNFPDPIYRYLLPQALIQLGKPDQIWVTTWPDDPLGTELPFKLALYYSGLGVFIEYEAYREKSGNDYLGCMGQASIFLLLEDPEQKREWSVLAGDDADNYKPLEEATSLTLDQFYEQFKDPANTACIHTPQSLWVEAK